MHVWVKAGVFLPLLLALSYFFSSRCERQATEVTTSAPRQLESTSVSVLCCGYSDVCGVVVTLGGRVLTLGMSKRHGD